MRLDHQNNGIAVHVNKNLHEIHWDSAEILDQETNWFKRGVKEALYTFIRNEEPNMDVQLGPGPPTKPNLKYFQTYNCLIPIQVCFTSYLWKHFITANTKHHPSQLFLYFVFSTTCDPFGFLKLNYQ